MALNKAKANKAMAISEKYKSIVRMYQDIEVTLRQIEEMVAADGNPDFDSNDVLKLRLQTSESMPSEIVNGQAKWNNVAYARGFYDVESGPVKMSKSKQQQQR